MLQHAARLRCLQVHVAASESRNRIFVGGLPLRLSQEQLLRELKAELKGAP